MSIHGVAPEISETEENNAGSKLSDNQKEAMENARLKAIERKKLEFKNRRG